MQHPGTIQKVDMLKVFHVFVKVVEKCTLNSPLATSHWLVLQMGEFHDEFPHPESKKDVRGTGEVIGR